MSEAVTQPKDLRGEWGGLHRQWLQSIPRCC